MPSSALDSATFKRPSFHGDFDMEVFHALCPEDATCKGMFFDDLLGLIQKLPEGQRAQVRPARPRYLPFKDYPLREHMRLSADAMPLLYPGVPLRRAYREMGWRAYPIVEASMIGKVIFGIFGSDLDSIFRVGPKGFAMALSHSELVTEKIGERHWRCTMRNVFGALDPYYIGVFEGPILHHGFTPDVRIHSTSLVDAILDIQWS